MGVRYYANIGVDHMNHTTKPYCLYVKGTVLSSMKCTIMQRWSDCSKSQSQPFQHFQSFQTLEPLGHTRNQSFQLLVPSGLTSIRPFQLLVLPSRPTRTLPFQLFLP